MLHDTHSTALRTRSSRSELSVAGMSFGCPASQVPRTPDLRGLPYVRSQNFIQIAKWGFWCFLRDGGGASFWLQSEDWLRIVSVEALLILAPLGSSQIQSLCASLPHVAPLSTLGPQALHGCGCVTCAHLWPRERLWQSRRWSSLAVSARRVRRTKGVSQTTFGGRAV